jgi:hypothetical protein
VEDREEFGEVGQAVASPGGSGHGLHGGGSGEVLGDVQAEVDRHGELGDREDRLGVAGAFLGGAQPGGDRTGEHEHQQRDGGCQQTRIDDDVRQAKRVIVRCDVTSVGLFEEGAPCGTDRAHTIRGAERVGQRHQVSEAPRQAPG